MAGSSTTTWTSSILLLLLPFFISFHQTLAKPLHSCNEAACVDIGVKEFMKDLEVLELLKKNCSRSYNLSSVLSNLPTTNKTCAFPGNFSHGVRNLLSLDLTKCYLQNDDVAVTHLKALEKRLNLTNKCPFLVDLYCKNNSLKSAPIASLDDFLKNLNTLLESYPETCHG